MEESSSPAPLAASCTQETSTLKTTGDLCGRHDALTGIKAVLYSEAFTLRTPNAISIHALSFDGISTISFFGVCGVRHARLLSRCKASARNAWHRAVCISKTHLCRLSQDFSVYHFTTFLFQSTSKDLLGSYLHFRRCPHAPSRLHLDDYVCRLSQDFTVLLFGYFCINSSRNPRISRFMLVFEKISSAPKHSASPKNPVPVEPDLFSFTIL